VTDDQKYSRLCHSLCPNSVLRCALEESSSQETFINDIKYVTATYTFCLKQVRFSVWWTGYLQVGAHPASFAMGTKFSFPRGKATGAWSWPPTFI